jgi:hypothetical protein
MDSVGQRSNRVVMTTATIGGVLGSHSPSGQAIDRGYLVRPVSLLLFRSLGHQPPGGNWTGSW